MYSAGAPWCRSRAAAATRVLLSLWFKLQRAPRTAQHLRLAAEGGGTGDRDRGHRDRHGEIGGERVRGEAGGERNVKGENDEADDGRRRRHAILAWRFL